MQIAKNCTKDFDGDGVIDQWGLSAHSNWYYVFYMLYSNNVTIVGFNDNEPVYNLKSAPAQRTLQFISDLAYVYKVYKQSSVTSASGLYQQGKAAMAINNAVSTVSPKLILAGMNTKAACLPIGPDAKDYTNYCQSQFYCVSSLCDIPREAANIWLDASMMWTDKLDYRPEYYELYNKYYPADWMWNPDNTARYVTSEKEYRLVFLDSWSRIKNDFSQGYPNMSTIVTNMIATPLLAGTMSVSQAVDSAEGVLHDLINQYK